MLAGAQADDMADRSSQGFLSKSKLFGFDDQIPAGDYDKFITPNLKHMKYGVHDALSYPHSPAEQGHATDDSKYLDGNWDYSGIGAAALGERLATTLHNQPTLSTIGTLDPIDFAPGKGEPLNAKEFDPPEITGKEEEKSAQTMFANDSNMPISLAAIGIGLVSLATMLGVRMRRGLQPETISASSSGLEHDMPMSAVPALGDNIMEMQSQNSSVNHSATAVKHSNLHELSSRRHGWEQLSSQNSHQPLRRYAAPATAEEAAAAVLPTNADPEMVAIRHSTSHIMALAVKRVYGEGVQVTIGPWIENGFYYDFYRKDGEPIVEGDLKKIKKEMDKIIKKNYPIIREVLPRDEARARLVDEGETFKVEVLDGIPDEKDISFYRIGDEWWDLCAGPHVETTGAISPKAIALESVAGAYWRGDGSHDYDEGAVQGHAEVSHQ